MKTVLLAYGRDQDGAAVETLLQSRGYRVLRARSGTEALDAARREIPEVLVADVMLPRMDGFALCRRIKEDDLLRHMSVVLHSFRVEGPKYEAFAIEVGAERFLPRGALLEDIAKLVEGARPFMRPKPPTPAELPKSPEPDVQPSAEANRAPSRPGEPGPESPPPGSMPESDRRHLDELEQRASELQAVNLQLQDAEAAARAQAEHETRARAEHAAADLHTIRALQSRIRDLEVAQQRLIETEQRALGIARETRAEAGKVSVLEMRLDELQATRATALANRADARRVFAALSTPTWVADMASGTVLEASESAAVLFDRGLAEVIGRPLPDLLPSLPMQGEEPWPRRVCVDGAGRSSATLGVDRVPVSYDGRGCWLMSARDLSAEEAGADAMSATLHMERVMQGLVDGLATISELQDACKVGRTRRVAELAGAIGTTMGLTGSAVAGLRVIGQLLDVGMIHVPRELLWRTGTLSPAEFDLVKTHPERGYELLRRIEFPWPVADAVRQHHERLDGSGYPRGLCGDEIMLEARIVAVADAVDAMLSPRPHRPALRLESCLAELQSQAGRRYDERVVTACLGVLQARDDRIAIATGEVQRVA